jgi:hypothetical protein
MLRLYLSDHGEDTYDLPHGLDAHKNLLAAVRSGHPATHDRGREHRFSGHVADCRFTRLTWMRRTFAGAFVALGAKLAPADR